MTLTFQVIGGRGVGKTTFVSKVSKSIATVYDSEEDFLQDFKICSHYLVCFALDDLRSVMNINRWISYLHRHYPEASYSVIALKYDCKLINRSDIKRYLDIKYYKVKHPNKLMKSIIKKLK